MRFVKTLENLFFLPQGFTRVEYLESTGTQYIDTGFKVDDTCGYDIKWMALNANDRIIFGTKGAGDSRWVLSGINNPNVNLSWNTSYGGVGLGLNKIQTAQMNYFNDRKRILNDTPLENITATLSSNASTYNVGIFAGYWGASSVSLYSTCRIYYAKITKGTEVIRDFIPCIDPLGVPCMYDLVGKKPYYNQGTGDFTTGRQIIPVEYLEGTGTQYIDTGVDIGAEIELEFSFYATAFNGSTYCSPLSARRTNLINSISYAFNNGTTYASFGNNAEVQILPTVQVGTKHVIIQNKEGLWQDGNKTNYAQGYNTNFTETGHLYMFARNNIGSSVGNYFIGRIYYCKIWDNGVLVRDFIPCKDENNVGFMFDKVSGTVYLNAGTGAFGVGKNKYKTKLRLIREVGSIPAGCIEVEFLQSTGTQYIDTGIKGKNNLQYKTKINYTNLSTSASNGIGGEYLGNASAYIGMVRANGHFTYLFNNTAVETTKTFYANTDYVIDSTMNNGSQIVKVNNETISTGTLSGTFTSTRNIFLYAICSTNDAADVYGSLKIYYLKIYDNDTLVRDFIPVLDWNMKPCLFDKVTEQLFYNQGTGDFVAGREIHPVDYLESTGTQYIDTGIIGTEGVLSEIDVMKTTATTNECFLGTWNSGSARCWLAYAFSNKWYPGYGGAASDMVQVVQNSWTHIKTYITQVNARKYFGYNINGIDYTLTGYFTSFTGQNTILIFAMNTNTGANYKATGRIGTCKITKDGVLVRDFIPAIDENGVAYFFDRVSHTCYLNKGTGSFLVGRPVCKVRFIKDVVPREYVAVNYIESTGTQYIDTGVLANGSFDAEYKIKTDSTNTRNFVVAGSRTATQHLNFGQFEPASKNFILAYLGNWWTINNKTYLNKEYETKVHYESGNQYAILNGETIGNASLTGTEQLDINIYLFKRNFYNPGAQEGIQPMIGKMYYFKIWNNNVLVRNFIPVVRRIDKVAGMWDTVTKQFFTTPVGAFNYG